MTFESRLRAAGFNTRFQVVQYVFRADAATDGGDGGADGEPVGEPAAGGEGESQAGGNTLNGLAVPFNSPTRINDWFEGEFDEEFAPGSFLRTIAEDKQVMLFDHGMHPMFGDIPISEIQSLGEAKDGLRVRAELFRNWMTEPLREPIARGLMRMSIIFRPRAQIITERDGDVPLVRITDAELRELGPVTFPAYPDTWIDLRSLDPSVRQQVESARRPAAARSLGGAKPAGPINRSQANWLYLKERTSK